MQKSPQRLLSSFYKNKFVISQIESETLHNYQMSEVDSGFKMHFNVLSTLTQND